MEALKSFNAREISVVTPYIDEVNEREKEFLESYGFSILSIKGMGIEKNRDIGNRRSYTGLLQIAKEIVSL